MVKFILIKSPDEWATTKQACRDELVVYLFFSPIYIYIYIYIYITNYIYIYIYVYSKPTDSHLYLPPSSCHPKHVFKAIAFGVAMTLKRNCSNETFFAERTAEYKGYLLNQGYPSKLVNDKFPKASAFSRNDLLQTRAKEAKKLFPFVTTFNPNLPDVRNIIKIKAFVYVTFQSKIKRTFPTRLCHTSFSSSKIS